MERRIRRRCCLLPGWLCLVILWSTLDVAPALRFPLIFNNNNNNNGEQQQQQKEQVRDKNNDGSSNNNNNSEKHHPSPEAFTMPPGYDMTGAPTAAAAWLSRVWEQGKILLQDHLEMQRKTYQKMYSILLYKPPVGIVTVYTVVHLVMSGRIFRVYSNQHRNEKTAAVNDKMQDEHKPSKQRRRNKGRAWTLEERDQSYLSFGVMERVRGRLCSAALSDMVEHEEELHPAFAMERAALFRRKKRTPKNNSSSTSSSTQTEEEDRMVQTPWIYGTALDALQIACPPGGSRYDYLDQLRESLAKLRAAEFALPSKSTSSSLSSSQPRLYDTSNPNISIVQVATRVVEMRAIDAILRESRDGLLKSTYRLARTVKYWGKRVEQARAMAVVQQSLIRDTIDGDRLRLSYAKAAYDAELERLGRVCAVLLMEKPAASSDASKNERRSALEPQVGRPVEMKDSYLMRALQMSSDDTIYTPDNDGSGNGSSSSQYPPHYTRRDKKKWRHTWRLPKVSRYSLRIERGKPKIIHLDKETYIDGTSAMNILVEDDSGRLDEWYTDASLWIKEAQATLCDVLEDSLEGSVPKSGDQTTWGNDLDMIRNAWGIGAEPGVGEGRFLSSPMKVYNDTYMAWSRVLALVEEIRDSRRVGEGKSVRFRDLSIVGWLSGFDAFAVPSTLLKIYLAHIIHTLVAPHWPVVRSAVKEAWEACVIIFVTRFWEPGKDVVLDILNRRKSSMLDDFNLRNEEHSLDVMLKDMKLGDGTELNRANALEAATRQYEKDLREGLFRNVASGHLLRLLLIQVQQIKVGMLNAVGDIDVLLSANKLNVRVLATIPALIFFTLGTRFFVRNLYNLRSRDLRPISRVHDEMTEHLHRMQSILLLSDGSKDTDDFRPSKQKSSASSSFKIVGSAELGELSLKMHCYLVLLDFCSPQPFPKSQCDAIHRSMQEILSSLQQMGPGNASIERPMALIEIVLKKHQDLRKFL